MTGVRVRAHRRVDAPVDLVWQVLTDHAGMSSWAPGVRVRLERPGHPDPGGLGAVREVKMAGLTIRELVTAADPLRRMDYRCVSGLPLRDYAGSVLLEPADVGTDVTWVLGCASRSFLVAAALSNQARVFVGALARAAERAAQRGDRPSNTATTPPQTREHQMQNEQPNAVTLAENPSAASSSAPTSDLAAAASLAETFQAWASRDPEAVAVSTPDGSVRLTWQQYADRVRTLAAAFHAHGVRRGDTVALMMTNRPEFFPVDTALLHLGAVPFSLYNTSTPQQVRWLLDSASPRIIVCGKEFAATVLEAVPGSSVTSVVCVDADVPGTVSLDDFTATATAEEGFDFDATWRAVGRDDVLTLIYTSGTTGEPKGVQLTHGNMLAQVAATNVFLQARPGDRVISFLPSAHVADRWAGHYLQLCTGTTVFPLADRTQLLAAMLQVRPTLFGAVPQIWQKLRAFLLVGLAAEQDQQRADAVRAALATGTAYVQARDRGAVTPELVDAFATADSTVLSAIRGRLGLDQARIVMSGAAPVPAEVVEFFNALAIPLIDGWGMSELSCMGAFMPADELRLGSVGKALPGTELRLAADGELLVRGPIVMRGYWGRPELTAEVVDDEGWLHTGDIARIDEDGYLFIVDRKKELIVTSSGKNLSPSAIESRLKAASPLIGQVVAVGDARPFVTALVVLDPDSAAQYAATRGLPADPKVLAADDTLVHAIHAAVDTVNTQVAPVEHIRKLAVLPEFWEPGTDLLTHTMKLRRRQIGEHYADVIDALYALPRDEVVLRAVPS